MSKKRISKHQQQVFMQLCMQKGLPKPVPEYRFAKRIGRAWRIDYYFTNGDIQVGLEVEGGVWTGGRHTRPQGFLKDMEKYNAMSKLGIFLIRVTPTQLNTMATIKLIRDTLNQFSYEAQ